MKAVIFATDGRLVAEGQLAVYHHAGFWQNINTLRDKHLLEKMWDNGAARWRIRDRDRPAFNPARAAEGADPLARAPGRA